VVTDLLVVGGGPGGIAAAGEGRRRGASVVLVERAAPGGTCTHGGCIPAGAFHRTAALLDELTRAAPVGIGVADAAVDWGRMQDWVGRTVRRAASMAGATLESAGVEVLAAGGRFTAPGRVEAGARVFEGVPVILATGAVSVVPELAEPPRCPVLTNADAMALSRAPDRLLVLDAARFGLEWADFFAHMGSRVTVATPDERLLPAEDADIAGFLQVVLEQRGVQFLLGTRAEDALVRVECDAVLFADARIPATEGLGLQAAGLPTGPDGAVRADVACRTALPWLFAAGDVTGGPWLSNRARSQGLVAATNALGGAARFRPERVPRSINTHPEVAAVGLTEDEARARGLEVGVGFGELAASLRGIALGQDQGALKLVVDTGYGEILGAHMIGVGAIEVIAQVATAIELEADYRDLARVSHVHPSLAELVTDAIASI